MKHKLFIAPTRELKELIEQNPSRLERLLQRALFLNGKPARHAAGKLLAMALEVQDYLGPVLMTAPHLLKNEASNLFAFPVLIALSRGHEYYYQRVLKQVRKLNLGSKTGIASHARANWKSEGETGTWAVALYNTVQALRTGSEPRSYVIKAYVRHIRMHHPTIATNAAELPPFGPDSVDEWINKACSPVLYVFRPKLRPAKRGMRKHTDKERADPRAKRQRDAIVQRIREMVAGPDKGHSWLKQSK
jgi:hypothetical protein